MNMREKRQVNLTSNDGIGELSGSNGILASLAGASGRANDSMTGLLDKVWGAVKVDTNDASCNTCANFVRVKFDRKENPPSIWGFPGHCTKFDRATTGWERGQFCGIENAECYENRRTGLTPRLLELSEKSTVNQIGG